VKTINIFKIILCAGLLTNFPALASNYFDTESEEAAYQQGLSFGKQRQYEKALECLLPLAQKGYPKAEYFYGVTTQNMGNEQEAYYWYRQASKKGDKRSQNKLEQMNLLYLLLPNEILAHIASFLSMKEFPAFKGLSKKSYQLAWGPMLKNGYKIDEIFRDVTFEPEPSSIELLDMIAALSHDGFNTSIEVHFRDSAHLREVFAKTPYIRAKDIIFVQDEEVDDESVFILSERNKNMEIQRDYCIKVYSDCPLLISGSARVPCTLLLPGRSTFNDGCSLSCPDVQECRLDQSYVKAMKLAKKLDSEFGETLCRQSTAKARRLLKNSFPIRQIKFEEFQSFMEFKKNIFVYDQELIITQKPTLFSPEPIVYVANESKKLFRLYNLFPAFNYINYVNNKLQKIGIYTIDPIEMTSTFEIFAPGNLIIYGTVGLTNFNISIKAGEDLWLINADIQSAGGIVASNKKIYFSSMEHEKPEELPQEAWATLLQRYYE
jgi:TPR repeat protein